MYRNVRDIKVTGNKIREKKKQAWEKIPGKVTVLIFNKAIYRNHEVIKINKDNFALEIKQMNYKLKK
jgi:hypothetical protein